jgi:integrase
MEELRRLRDSAMLIPAINFLHLSKDKDRHGKIRYYARKRGAPHKLPVKGALGSPEFVANYHAAIIQLHASTSRIAAAKVEKDPRTLRWLAREFENANPFLALDKRSQRVRRGILNGCCDEPVEPGATDLMGECPIKFLEPKMIKVMRDRKIDKLAASKHRVQALRIMLAWGVEQEYLKVNVAADVKPHKYKKVGFHTWTAGEVKQYLARHDVGSKARLAMSLMLFTGARRSDAVEFGPANIKDGWLTFTPNKTSASSAKKLQLPVLPQLRAVLDESDVGEVAFLQTAQLKPFTANGFGGWFRERCDEAGLPHCTAHGLRKAGAVIAAENGATEKQMMAIFGWDSPALAALYSRQANQKKLAKASMHLLVEAHEDL